jgi:PD-(D/E)XK nuclease superfamily
MIYSYTQIANYLRCPRSYRYRCLDGWREKETRAALMFGRCFAKALEAYFCGADCGATLYREWGAYREAGFAYKQGETWDRLVHQGVHLLGRFAQDNRIRISQPKENLQIKVVRELPNANQFVSYIDAIGKLDGVRCVLDWKTTASRYPDERLAIARPAVDLLFLDHRYFRSRAGCLRGKHQPEIQYLKTSISEEQRSEFGRLLAATISQIESAQFPAHSGIRFPQNGCLSCSHMGLCLDDPKLIDANLIRTTGGNDLAWLDDPVD